MRVRRPRSLPSWLLLTALVGGCHGSEHQFSLNDIPPPPPLRADQVLPVPVIDEIGEVSVLVTRVCRPAGAGPFPVAVINHPAAQPGEARETMRPPGCDSPPARWFLARSYLVVMPLRRGYGGNDGGWAMNPGSCASPDFARSAREGGRDIAAAVTYIAAVPEARRDGLVVVGEDEGGWAALGYASIPNPNLAAVIDVGGGMGGRAAAEAGHVCRPDLLIDAAATLGAKSPARILWIYAASDRVFQPELAARLIAAYDGAGGRAQIAVPGGPGTNGTGDPGAAGDGHIWLFTSQGEQVWSPLFERFLGA